MDEQVIREQVNSAWDDCGKCSKYVGALMMETIRQALQKNGIPVSTRDVFIKEIPIEFDLVIPRHGAPEPIHGILYEPEDVVAVLEIKASGLCDYNSKNRIEACREKVLKENSKIFFGYVTLSENQKFHEKNFHEDEWAYPLFWWRGKDKYDSTGSWQKLLNELHKCINAQ